MSERICETCRFWARHETNKSTGDCRRLPPSVRFENIDGWPVVTLEGWCGEWASKDDEWDFSKWDEDLARDQVGPLIDWMDKQND